MWLSEKGMFKRIIQGKVKIHCDCAHLERFKLRLRNTKVHIMTALSQLLMFKMQSWKKKWLTQKQHSPASVDMFTASQ